MAKKKIEEPVIIETISDSAFDQIMGDDYSIYAKYVIKNRAIPDVRDGLKPVQRRIIFSMYENGYLFSKPTKKSARIVGDVMGKYHPHGDSSIYEALVRMSQNWKINMNLIDFQGNNGSIDGDGAAANRYTEARLSLLAEELINDIDKNTVDMELNFDDTEFEPNVLPAKFPNLLLNGAEGIAIAMATEIPPHNLKELIDATIYRISNPNSTVLDLMQFVKAPDFPTGAKIIDSNGIFDMYSTGKGKIELRSTYEIKTENDKHQIIISEIPYKVVKKNLVYSIDKIRQSKEIDGIIEVIDATEMHEVKILINIKKEADPNIILNYLLQKTELQTSYSANMVAISNGRPVTLTLDSYLDDFINHRRIVIKRKSEFELKKHKARVNILNGLIKAVSIIDEVVETIRKSSNKADAKNNIISKFDFNEEQAEAIVTLQLYRLTNTDITKLEQEKLETDHEIETLEALLADPKKIDKAIVVDLKYISSRYSVDRKSEIIQNELDISINKRDLITKEDVMLSITKDGYVKRSSLKSYKTSNSLLPGIKENDILVCANASNTLDYALAFTNKGNYLFLPVNEINEGKWKDEGKHINYLVELPFDERIIKVIGVEEFIDGVNVVTASKRGQIKRTSILEFQPQRYSKPISCMKLLKGDELADVVVTTGNDDLIIINSNGGASCFNENELTLVLNKTAGVKSYNNLKDAQIVSLQCFAPDTKAKLILLTDKGNLRVVDSSNVEKTARLGKSTTLFKSFKSDPHKLISVLRVGKDFEFDAENPDSNIIFYQNKQKQIIELKVNDIYLTPMDKYAKTNIDIKEDDLILDIYRLKIDYVRRGTKTIKIEPKIEENIINNAIDDSEFIQTSIFDELGD